jgi:hypothetical protein
MIRITAVKSNSTRFEKSVLRIRPNILKQRDDVNEIGDCKWGDLNDVVLSRLVWTQWISGERHNLAPKSVQSRRSPGHLSDILI